MRSRLVVAASALALLVAACSAGPTGPADPVGTGRAGTDDAAKAAGARDAARRFVDVYAAASTDGVRSLSAMVETPLLRRWVRWLEIQNRAFPGTIAGIAHGIQVGPAVPFEVESVPGSAQILREVDVRASIAFSFEPTDGDPFTVTRSLDGPMRLVREPGGAWGVLDFTRDGLPLSQQFETVEGARAAKDGVVAAVEVFFSTPIWQFGLVMTSSRATTLSPKRVVLVDADGTPVATAGAITDALARMRPDATARGLVTFDARGSADGLSLRLDLRGPYGAVVLSVPLTDRIHPVAVATPSPSSSGS